VALNLRTKRLPLDKLAIETFELDLREGNVTPPWAQFARDFTLSKDSESKKVIVKGLSEIDSRSSVSVDYSGRVIGGPWRIQLEMED